ncbi:MAG: AraC family transcriptional regulator [Novosphingobium sp.]|uniref:helix-turn-helix domain-containing protein n=1 Tax=Novosphingobium sp. TaxID=1874826 RepID=UPI0022BD5BF5|nr:AraC family transcriptional regulator [Novosphingobium sp.]MCZ8036502.1 AraC family transcriptional regulator [Novosphingobium sp.]
MDFRSTEPDAREPVQDGLLIARLLTGPRARDVRDRLVAPPGGCLTTWQMRRIDDCVRSNLSTGLSIEDIAEVLSLSPCYSSRAFKATEGVTYSEFVLEARVELAKRQLLTTDTPIAEIALGCGLADQSHLTRVFRKSVGMPPAAWRRQFGNCTGRRLKGWNEPARFDMRAGT